MSYFLLARFRVQLFIAWLGWALIQNQLCQLMVGLCYAASKDIILESPRQ
jgi:hypothetical protein